MTLSRFAALWVFVILSMSCGAKVQAAERLPFNFLHPYLIIPDSLVKVTAYKEAIGYYNSAKRKFEKEKNWRGVVKCNNKISFCYRKLLEYDNMINMLTVTLKLANTHLGLNHLLTAETKFYFGEYYFRKNDAAKSLNYYDSALQIIASQNKILNLERASVYNGIGSVYQYKLYNSEKASDFFLKALKIRQQLLTDVDLDLATSYYNMSTLNRSIGNYESAIEYGLAAVQLSKKHVYEKSFQANCVLIVANTYFDALRFNEAIDYYSKAIEMMIKTRGATDISLAMYYNNIGTAYNEIKEHSRAMQYFAKALYVNKLNDYADVESQSDTYFNYGIAYQFLNKVDSADYFFKQGLILKRALFGDKHQSVSINYQYIGDLFESQHAFDSALWYYQKALIAGIESFNNIKIDVNPLKEQIGLDQHLIMALRYKARSLKDKYLHTKNRKFLDQAMNTFLLTDSAVVIYRNHFYKEGTKLILSYVFKNTYEDALEVISLLHDLTQDEKYAHYALQFMEQTKAMYLREFVEKQKRYKASVPDSLLEKDRNLILRIGELKQLLGEAKVKKFNEIQIDSIQSEIFKYAQAHETLNDQLHKKYPDFFVVKYAGDISQDITSNDLSSKTMVLEYFWGQKAIYMVSLNGHEIYFTRQVRNNSLLEALKKYKEELTGVLSDQDLQKHFEDFASASFMLYKQLVAPMVNTESRYESLVIVPDGDLLYIPFDAFTTKLIGHAARVNYRSLDYLIKDYLLSYQYSLSLMHSLKRIEKKPSGNLLGFAYSGSQSNAMMTQQRVSNGALPGTSKEVDAIAAMIKGKYFYGEDATEKNFKLNASDFSLIHFALHGEGSDSLSSARLIFKNGKSDDEDGSLYPYELHSVKLNADLVVLSSCETGIGKLYDGEGTYSMARGFVLAGCPSVVMTLWKINDDATASIMTNFYENIDDGDAVDKSLRDSKLTYLKTASEIGAHPSNWAALVPLGEMSPVRTNILSIQNAFILVVSIGVVILILFRMSWRSNW
jgi:CHAT domain-containing protein/tetratricopeptide (TPR) repeat protein